MAQERCNNLALAAIASARIERCALRSEREMKTALRALFVTVTILLALAFVMVGLSKLAGQSSVHWAERFARWGYPAVLRPVVGVLEMIGGIALLIPAATRTAAGVLIVVMTGACYTHLSHGEPLRIVPSLVLGVFLVLLWRQPLRHRLEAGTDPGSED